VQRITWGVCDYSFAGRELRFK